MGDPLDRLGAALADRYRLERELDAALAGFRAWPYIRAQPHRSRLS